jgi:membrane protein YdbS with pleckstrin-like domain
MASPYLRNHHLSGTNDRSIWHEIPRAWSQDRFCVWHDAGMGISQKLLSDGEHVVLSVRSHGKVLIGPVAWLIFVVAGVVAALTLRPDNSILALVAAVVALPLLVLWSLIPFLRWVTSTYTVTNRRLITRHGILTRTGRDIPLFRINDVAYEKGLLDRLLGCGTLIISDATEKAGVVLPDIPDVEQVHLQISDLLFAKDDGRDDDGSRVPDEPPRNTR